MVASQVVQKLEEEGFKVKISDGGIIAYLHHRTPSRAEIVDAVPELKKCPMGRVEEGVLVEFEDNRFLP
ncbi:hypothetical protein GGQ04_002905 [Salinibacter ruber]|uniref:Rhodanese domain-containing protein n=1 Tax=Salinibacter ruber TaxID=146919 RepID=A0AAW5P4W9_9BACT|nr:hypothetical protein [Salinibacter ruber]MCS4047756.1 hypothetical protein [Salinibacter ruber]MCS4156928.1 hypothetical protein [Salinibacter ruber]